MQHDAAPRPGAPSRYRPEFSRQAGVLCRLGATDEDLADVFNVSRRTICRWKRARPEFRHALKNGKLVADANVAEALYRRAVGYSHQSVKIAASPDGQHVAIPYVRNYPPDTTAAIFWLKNRRPGEWSEKRAHQVTGSSPQSAIIGITHRGMPIATTAEPSGWVY